MGGTCTDYASSPTLGAGATSLLPDGINELQLIANPPTGSVALGSSGLIRLNGGDYDGVITYGDGRVVQIAPDQDAQHPSVQRTSPDGTSPAVYTIAILSSDGQTLVSIKNITDAQRTKIQQSQGIRIENGFLVRDTSGMCRFNKGPYAGLITYDDGRIAQIAPDQDAEHPSVIRTSANGQPAVYSVTFLSAPGSTQTKTHHGVSQAQLDLIRGAQKTEVGSCSLSGGSYQVQPLPMRAGPWSVTQARGLMSLFSDQPNHVFFCADGSQQGEMGINTSSGQGAMLQEAMDKFREDGCTSVLGANSSAQCSVFQKVADRLAPPLPDHGLWQEYKHHIIGFVSLVAGFFILGPRIQKKWGGGDHGVTPKKEEPPSQDPTEIPPERMAEVERLFAENAPEQWKYAGEKLREGMVGDFLEFHQGLEKQKGVTLPLDQAFEPYAKSRGIWTPPTLVSSVGAQNEVGIGPKIVADVEYAKLMQRIQSEKRHPQKDFGRYTEGASWQYLLNEIGMDPNDLQTAAEPNQVFKLIYLQLSAQEDMGALGKHTILWDTLQSAQLLIHDHRDIFSTSEKRDAFRLGIIRSYALALSGEGQIAALRGGDVSVETFVKGFLERETTKTAQTDALIDEARRMDEAFRERAEKDREKREVKR